MKAETAQAGAPFPMDKRHLRQQLRQARRAIPETERRGHARRLARVVLSAGLLHGARRIGFYLPFDGEADLLPLMNRALLMGRVAYLPVVPPRFRRRLSFTRLTARPSWYLNRFGIHEHWSPRPVSARQLDLLFLPLVGFDAAGRRLGMGGGFYDATLAYLRQRSAWQKPRLIGVAFECQRVGALPHDAWDVPLDAVVTERRLYRCR